jgi:membrane protein implicated in regulation of membrane protease activity
VDEKVGFTKLIFFALVVLAGWYFYRKFVTDAMKLAKASQAKRQEHKNGALGTLVQDPVTGEYRLRKEQED